MTGWKHLRALTAKHPNLTALGLLIIVQALVFGPIVAHVGFYLDDWLAIATLKQAPRDLVGLSSYYFLHEPRIVNRPLEILHFGSMFLLFGSKPLLYHIANGALEILSAWLLYRCLRRITGMGLICVLAAVLFLINPIHDATHYWVMAGSVTLSLVLLLLSTDCCISYATACDAKSRLCWLSLATTCFTLMLANYEVFLPLLAINAAVVVIIRRYHAKSDWTAALKRGMIAFLALCLPVLGYLAYLRFLSLAMPNAWLHAAHIDAGNIIGTVCKGTGIALGAEPFQLGARVLMGPGFPLNAATVTAALATGCLCAFLMLRIAHSASAIAGEQNSVLQKHVYLGACGLAVVVLSYTIFGLNPEYQPTLLTMVNRINTGAAVGASILLAAMLSLLASLSHSVASKSAVAACCCFIAIAFVLTDVGMSPPWVLSQTMQKHVLQIVKGNAKAITSTRTLMLADCPRYIYWAPVFDGTWDFQSAVRVTLNDGSIHAGVVSDRLTADDQSVSDISCNYVCGKFGTSHMLVLDAPTGNLIPVHSTAQFITAVRKHGMGFDLDPKAPDRWQRELASKLRTFN